MGKVVLILFTQILMSSYQEIYQGYHPVV